MSFMRKANISPALIPVTEASILASLALLLSQSKRKSAAAAVGVKISRFRSSPEKSIWPLVGSVSIIPLEKAQRRALVPAFIITFFLSADKSFLAILLIKASISIAVISPNTRPLKKGSQ